MASISGTCQDHRNNVSGLLLCVVLRFLRLLWLVDPDGAGQQGRRRGLIDEALGVGGVGGIEHLGPLGPHAGGGAEVDRSWCVQAESGMALGVVVVLEEEVGEGPGRRAAEALGKGRAVEQSREFMRLVEQSAWVHLSKRVLDSDALGRQR